MRGPDSAPTVGTFAWDLTAPSYLSFMVKPGKDGKMKPGFIACDVYLGGEVDVQGIRPFINKCLTLRRLRNVGPCMQIFVAHKYSEEAFALLKQNGIVPATPGNMFGDEIAEGLAQLSSVLTKAAFTALNPEGLDLLFKRLGKIEGASVQLRGTLFEYLAAEIARKTISHQVKMNQIFKSPEGKKAEADVVALVDDKSVTFIECKGYNPYADVPNKEFTHWLQHNVPVIYAAVKAHPEWKNLKVQFEFWSTASLSDDASAMFDTAKKTIKASRYTIELRLGKQIHQLCKDTGNDGLVTSFRKHFMKYPPVEQQGVVVHVQPQGWMVGA